MISARITFLGANEQGIRNMDSVMSDISIDFQTFEKCTLTYDKYDLNELLASADQYAEKKTKDEILQELIAQRRVPIDEQNNRTERIKTAVENAIVDSLRNFEEDIQNLPDGEEKSNEINRIAEQIGTLIQNAIPKRDLDNLGAGIVNRAINTAKTNAFANLGLNDDQKAVINRAVRRVTEMQNRRGAAWQAENRRIEQNYDYNLPQEVRRINDAKLEIRNFIMNPNATIQDRLERYINNYLAVNQNARNSIQNWINGRVNMSMRQIIEVLPNMEINKYLIPEFVPSENPNVYRANIFYPMYLVSQEYYYTNLNKYRSSLIIDIVNEFFFINQYL